VTLGGDRTVAIRLPGALHARHGPVALVHVDVHMDTWNTCFGQPYTNETPFNRAFEEGLLARDRTVHAGI
jgi:agmatinase